jgi:hypothetical protein
MRGQALAAKASTQEFVRDIFNGKTPGGYIYCQDSIVKAVHKSPHLCLVVHPQSIWANQDQKRTDMLSLLLV